MRWRWILLVGLVPLAACDQRPPVPHVLDEVHWHGLKQLGYYLPMPGTHREMAVYDGPEASHVSWDSRGAPSPRAHRFIVNIQDDATIYFKGHTWPTVGPALEETLATFGRELSTLTREVINAKGETYVLLRGDRSAPWRALGPTLSLIDRPEFQVRYLQIAVVTPRPESAGWDPYLAGEWIREGSARSASAGPALSIAIEGGAAAKQPVRLRCDGKTWKFPPGAAWYRYEPPEGNLTQTLAEANRIWAGLDAAAVHAKAGGATSIDLEIADDVPWAFVVEVMDIGIGAGLPEIRFKGTDLALRFEPGRSPPPSFVPGDDDPRDWSVPTALAIGSIAAISVFALSAYSLRARPRRRKTA